MNPLFADLALVGAAYLVGATPFGYLAGRSAGKIDIRRHGSGNIGATNVGRVLGARWGLAVLALDVSKGLAAVALLPRLFVAPDGAHGAHWIVAAGLAAILGHMFSCWLKFRGGKGVATALGVVAWLAPWASLTSGAVFALTFLIWRFASLSSILAAAAFAVCEWAMLWPAPFSDENWSLAAFSLIVPALIIVRHRENILRLMRGEETRYSSKEQPTREKQKAAFDRDQQQ